MEKVINDESIDDNEGIMHHEEGVDFIPANIELAGLETALVGVMSREFVLKSYLDHMKDKYDNFYIFIVSLYMCKLYFLNYKILR